VSRAPSVKGVRKHMGTRFGIIKYKYSHYFVRLEEGVPPKDYHLEAETYEARAKNYIEKLRKRSIFLSI
jgi:large subunit ribosomal protein L22